MLVLLVPVQLLVVLLVLLPLVLMVLVQTVRCELGLSCPAPLRNAVPFFMVPRTATSNRVRRILRGQGREL